MSLPRTVAAAFGPVTPAHYAVLDMRLVLRLGAALFALGALFAAALMPFAPPTAHFEAAGWAMAGAIIATAAAFAAWMVRAPRADPRELLVTGYGAVALIGCLSWLAGPGSPYVKLLLIALLYNAAVHPPRRVLPLLAWVAIMRFVPFLGSAAPGDEVTAAVGDLILWPGVAGVIMVWTARMRSLRRQLIGQHERADALARIDPLTELGNRRALDEALLAQTAVVERTGRPLAALFADLDDFKSINDRHGHAAGDECLRAAAAVVRETTRLPDACFRWGGDEIVVLLADTTPEQAEAVAERIRRRVAQRVVRPDAAPLGITLGAALMTPGMRPEHLLEAADAALMAAKTARRGIDVADPH